MSPSIRVHHFAPGPSCFSMDSILDDARQVIKDAIEDEDKWTGMGFANMDAFLTGSSGGWLFVLCRVEIEFSGQRDNLGIGLSFGNCPLL